MAEIFEKNMKKIQKAYDQYEAAMRDEHNWIDVEDEEETRFILQGKRISQSDLELLLEIAVKTNFVSDSQIIGSFENSHNKIKEGQNKVPLRRVIGNVDKSNRH